MNRINVTRSSMPDFEEYCEEIRSLWDSRWLTNMGEKHRILQIRLGEYLGVDNVNLVNNGHMSLETAIQAFDLKGEIITTPFTFASTVHAIVRSGCEPVFCDIEPETYTIDVSHIEKLITEKTCAIMPVHIYGNVCDIDKIQEIADRHGLKVIYDAAHTFGVKYRGRSTAAYGDAACFSFHATKVFHTIEGGAVCFKDKEYSKRLELIRNFGIQDEDTVSCIGLNAKMNEFSAAMGLCNLRHIEEKIAARKKAYDRYISNLKDVEGLKLNYVMADVESNYAYFPILVDKELFGAGRDEIKEKLAEYGIGSRKYFYPPVNEYECYKDRFDSDDTPVARDISRKVLTLPLYANLTDTEVDMISEIIMSLRIK